MKEPFDKDAGRQTSPTTFEWPCGCIVHNFEAEITAAPCSPEHDDEFDMFITSVLKQSHKNAPITRTFPDGTPAIDPRLLRAWAFANLYLSLLNACIRPLHIAIVICAHRQGGSNGPLIGAHYDTRRV